jgi:hypothetical protein
MLYVLLVVAVIITVACGETQKVNPEGLTWETFYQVEDHLNIEEEPAVVMDCPRHELAPGLWLVPFRGTGDQFGYDDEAGCRDVNVGVMAIPPGVALPPGTRLRCNFERVLTRRYSPDPFPITELLMYCSLADTTN